MSSRPEIIDALTAFYQQVIRHPYLDDTALKIPPTSGWDTIDSDKLGGLGKNNTVIEILRCLPYLESNREHERLLVEYETVPIAYTQRSTTKMEQVAPLPGHCIYLTEGVDREGYSLILDTEKGTITAYSISDYEISPEAEEYCDSLPQSEQWRAHRTLPAAEVLNILASKYARLVNMLVPNLTSGPTTGTFRSRVGNRLKGEQLARETGSFKEWHSDMQEFVLDIEDDRMRRHQIARWRHTADVYNCFLRHGWPDTFDKVACRVEVIELEKQAAGEENRFLDSNAPDAALFDD